MTVFSMTTTTPDEAPTVRKINISGDMTINHAGEIRTALQEALIEADKVLLDLEQVTEMDLVGLQLICSTHRTAVTAQKYLSVKGTSGTVMNAAARTAGFFRHVGCVQDVDHTCVWLGGGK